MSKGGIGFKKKGESRKEDRIFAKPNSTIMIEGQKNSEAWEVDKGGERAPWLKKKKVEKKKGGGYRNEIVQEEIEKEKLIKHLPRVENDNHEYK